MTSKYPTCDLPIDSRNDSTSRVGLCEPHLQGNAWRYVRQCLDTAWVSTAGAFVDRLQQMAADYIGRRHAIATVSGTAALHTALLVAGVEPDDEVLVSTLTFIAPANAIRYVGAWPVPIDAESQHWQIDPELVEHFLTQQCAWRDGELRNRATGRRVRAIVPVHVLGHPVDIAPILELARKFELTVIEDAAESLAARYQRRMVGGFGHLACLSFNGNKTITTGGGGMLLTDDGAMAQRARYLTTQAKDDPVSYIHNEVGYNYRMPNLAAALGCAQWEQLDEHVEAKRRIAARYAAALADAPGVAPLPESPEAECSYWLSTIQVDPSRFGVDRRRLAEHLAQLGIQTRPLWQPIHDSAAHRGCFSVTRGVADQLVAGGLSLPSSVGLSDKHQQRVIDAVLAAGEHNRRAA